MKVLNHPPYSPDLSPCDFLRRVCLPLRPGRKGYQARENRNRASMKKRRVDDEDFREAENESQTFE